MREDRRWASHSRDPTSWDALSLQAQGLVSTTGEFTKPAWKFTKPDWESQVQAKPSPASLALQHPRKCQMFGASLNCSCPPDTLPAPRQ